MYTREKNESSQFYTLRVKIGLVLDHGFGIDHLFSSSHILEESFGTQNY